MPRAKPERSGQLAFGTTGGKDDRRQPQLIVVFRSIFIRGSPSITYRSRICAAHGAVTRELFPLLGLACSDGENGLIRGFGCTFIVLFFFAQVITRVISIGLGIIYNYNGEPEENE